MVNSDREEVIGYFRKKGFIWKAASGSVEKYLKKHQRTGIKFDFQNDPEFRVVGDYLKQFGELHLRSTITEALEGVAGIWFAVPLIGTLDIIIGAAVEACGCTPLEDKLKRAARIAFMVVAAVIVIVVFVYS